VDEVKKKIANLEIGATTKGPGVIAMALTACPEQGVGKSQVPFA
jgi:hypothetical protein